MQEIVFLGMRWVDLINLVAIVVGPILAVAVDRLRQSRADTQSRRLAVFRALMRTRRHRLDPEHVGALNLVDLEFYGRKSVIEAFSAYMDHLASPNPTTEEGHERYFEQREDLLVKLLHEMGRDLGLHFDKHDLKKLAYGPAGWAAEQEIQRQNMTFLNELLAGKRALPITPMPSPPDLNPFPPPPHEIKAQAVDK